MILSFVRNLHTDFHSDCTSLHCHQQWIRVPFSHILTSIFVICFSIFFYLSHSVWGKMMKWKSVKVFLICISLMPKDIEHYLSHLCLIVRELFVQLHVPIFNYIVFLMFSLLCSLYNLNSNPLSGV